MEYIFAFKNTNRAISAEQRLLECGIRVGVLPLPSQVRAGCGICLRVNPDGVRAAFAALADIPADEMDVYIRQKENGFFIYTEVTDRSVGHDND